MVIIKRSSVVRSMKLTNNKTKGWLCLIYHLNQLTTETICISKLKEGAEAKYSGRVGKTCKFMARSGIAGQDLASLSLSWSNSCAALVCYSHCLFRMSKDVKNCSLKGCGCNYLDEINCEVCINFEKECLIVSDSSARIVDLEFNLWWHSVAAQNNCFRQKKMRKWWIVDVIEVESRVDGTHRQLLELKTLWRRRSRMLFKHCGTGCPQEVLSSLE